jgi:hypothetical protein
MIICMRTTIILEDELFREAKVRAAESGRTLSDLISDALRSSFRVPSPTPRERFEMPTFGGRKRVHHEPADFAAALEEDDRAR